MWPEQLWNDLPSFRFYKYKWSKVEIQEKITFEPVTFLGAYRDVHTKRERLQIIDLYLKRVFVGSSAVKMLVTFRQKSHDMLRDPSEAPNITQKVMAGKT